MQYWIYGGKNSAHYKASRLLKNSAHLDKCATAKTVHYFKNRDKIIIKCSYIKIEL
jgi:hypothetical protein